MRNFAINCGIFNPNGNFAKFPIKITFSIIFIIAISIVISSQTSSAPMPAASTEMALKTELLDMQAALAELSSKNQIGIARMNDQVSEAYSLLSRQEYSKVRELIDSTLKLINRSLETKKTIEGCSDLLIAVNSTNAQRSIENKSMIEIQKSTLVNLESAKREFGKENYEEAYILSQQAKTEIVQGIAQVYLSIDEKINKILADANEIDLANTRAPVLKELADKAIHAGLSQELELIEKESGQLEKIIDAYSEMTSIASQLEKEGLDSQRITDEQKSSVPEINSAQYNEAISRLTKAKQAAQKALSLKERINELKTILETGFESEETSAGAETKSKEEIRSRILKAESELKLGNYDEAEKILESSESLLESLKAQKIISQSSSGSAGKRQSLAEFIQKNWIYILAIIILAAAGYIASYRKISRAVTKNRIARLEQELKTRLGLVKKLQQDYFVKRKMPRDSYDEAYDRLQTRILSIKENLSLLNKKIKKEEAKTYQ